MRTPKISVSLFSGLSQPRPPEQQCPCLSYSLLSSCFGSPAAAAAQCGEARNDGPETGPVGPDGWRGGARLESGPAGHEAAKEGGGEAEVRWDFPASAFLVFLHICHIHGNLRVDVKEEMTFACEQKWPNIVVYSCLSWQRHLPCIARVEGLTLSPTWSYHIMLLLKNNVLDGLPC